MKRKIVVEVSDTGEIQIETKGFTGPACLEDSKFLKDLLGHEIAVQLCPSYYRKGKQVIKRHIPLCG